MPKRYIVGEKVWVEPVHSFGDPGFQVITAIKRGFNASNGKPYRIVCFEDWEFDAGSGLPLTAPYAYNIPPEGR